MINILKSEKKAIVLLLLMMTILRLVYLGYSEYIPDEGIVMTTLKNEGGFSWSFLQAQRKGPGQFLVGWLVYLLGINVHNEFLYRLPYAIASIGAVLFFYLFSKQILEDRTTALITAFLFGVNGFMVAFGKIVQYQSLNLLFSSICLYLFAKKNHLFGTVFFCLSFLSHWDAIFILPIVLYFIVKNFNHITFFKCILVVFLILAPFFVPYSLNLISNSGNQQYFGSRVGLPAGRQGLGEIDLVGKVSEYIFRTQVYNPFVFLPLVIVLFALSLTEIKKNWELFGWLLITFVVFVFFVKKPGTHTYNFFLPLSLLAGVGVKKIVLSKYSRIALPVLGFLLAFIFAQAYLIFANVNKEYPWEREKILWFKTKEYNHKNLTNNIIGFPHFRNWEDINAFLNSQNALSYITNEDKSISNFYIDIPYGKASEYYAVGIKRPLSFMNDYSFPQVKNKRTVIKIKGYKSDSVAKIYKVDHE